mmetsp:Transcript_23032/g.75072  ORF Transcript_23032/g.75072 Transcript_23032/m.75072 type:complete len:574 (-) Transcript_23032:69-1790(-)
MVVGIQHSKEESMRRVMFDKECATQWKQGYLYKKGRLMGKVVRRWFVLDQKMLTYCSSPKDAGAARPCAKGGGGVNVIVVGAITLGHVSVSRDAERASTSSDGSGGAQLFGIEISFSNGQKRVFYATSAAEAHMWVVAATYKALSVTQVYDMNMNKPLGHGGFATVMLAKRKSDRGGLAELGNGIIEKEAGVPCALKIISGKEYHDNVDIIEKEVTILNVIGRHPNIVAMREVLRTRTRLYVAMELCTGGELVQRMMNQGVYSERQVCTVVLQLSQALSYLRTLGVVHRDLKPENILYATPDPRAPLKLIDFGFAEFEGVGVELAGTPEFMAPELVSDPERSLSKGVAPAIDMWSVGIITYFLLSGSTPFHAKNMMRILDKIMDGKWVFHPNMKRVSSEAKAFIASLLTYDPAKRPTADDCIKNQWVLGNADSYSESLTETHKLLKLHDNMAKWRRAVRRAMAANTIRNVLAGKRVHEISVGERTQRAIDIAAQYDLTRARARARKGIATKIPVGIAPNAVDQEILRQFHIRRRLKKAMLAAMAARRLSTIIGSLGANKEQSSAQAEEQQAVQ